MRCSRGHLRGVRLKEEKEKENGWAGDGEVLGSVHVRSEVEVGHSSVEFSMVGDSSRTTRITAVYPALLR